VLTAAAISPTQAIANAIILGAILTAAVTSTTTVVSSKVLGSTSSLSECVKSNLSALIGAGLVFAFAFQVGGQEPLILFASPILAIGIAAIVLSKGLSLSVIRALGVTILSAMATYAITASVGRSITLGSH
jgi:hypothetical protein